MLQQSPAYPVLSIRQPWAGLIITGRKQIEIRKWSTDLRGRLLIHASQTPDLRPEALRHVTPEIAVDCQRFGGVIGLVELIECRKYQRPAEFVADQSAHLNAPDWFQSPMMYGFRFVRPVRLPFLRCVGQVRIFYVSGLQIPPIIDPPETTP